MSRNGSSGDVSRRDELPEDVIIFRYTRKQAIEDGVLVELTPWAKELGFVVPVACTCGLWETCIVPPEATKEHGQSERGRAHDVLWMLLCAIRGLGKAETEHAGRQSIVHFDVIFLMAPDQQQTVRLKAICGPGDQGEPVLTILLPHED